MRDFTRHPRLRLLVLLTVGGGGIVRGVGYYGAPSTSLTTFVDTLVPLWLWGVVWCLAGAAVLVGVFDRAVARVSVNLVGSLWAVWAVSYFAATLFGDSSRGWLTGAAMLCLACHSWVAAALMESSGPARLRGVRGA